MSEFKVGYALLFKYSSWIPVSFYKKGTTLILMLMNIQQESSFEKEYHSFWKCSVCKERPPLPVNEVKRDVHFFQVCIAFCGSSSEFSSYSTWNE